MNGSTNIVGLGVYLHYLQDTFSHAGYTNDEYGHSLGTHSVDKTFNNVPKAQSMVAATWKALNDYAKEKKCGCKGQWSNDMWPVINNFLEIPAGWGFEEIPEQQLKLKIRALNVPRR